MAKRVAETNRRTGELDDTIRVIPGQDSRGFIWRSVAGVREDSGFYARFLEFGTAKMQAEPFFFTSYRAQFRAYRARNGRAVRKAMKRMANSGPKN